MQTILAVFYLGLCCLVSIDIIVIGVIVFSQGQIDPLSQVIPKTVLVIALIAMGLGLRDMMTIESLPNGSKQSSKEKTKGESWLIKLH